MKKIVPIILLLMIISAADIFSQNVEIVKETFKKSYEMEKKGEYKNAADIMKKVYSEKSYEINLRLGWLEYNAGLFSESATHYQKALNIKPYSEEAKFGLIYPKVAMGKWTEVINIYQKILKISPNNTTANYRLGLIYYGKKDYQKAIKFFEKVINLYPFGYDGLIMCAWTNYMLGQNKKAKILFNKTLMLSPDDKSAKEGLELVK